MGPHTLTVPMELFALNRRRLCEALRTKVTKVQQDGAVVLLQGGEEVPVYCTDVNYEFKQVRLKSDHAHCTCKHCTNCTQRERLP